MDGSVHRFFFDDGLSGAVQVLKREGKKKNTQFSVVG
jgi:hypothetical protein